MARKVQMDDDAFVAFEAFLEAVFEDDVEGVKEAIDRMRTLKEEAKYPFLADLGVEALLIVLKGSGLFTVYSFTLGPRVRRWIKREKKKG